MGDEPAQLPSTGLCSPEFLEVQAAIDGSSLDLDVLRMLLPESCPPSPCAAVCATATSSTESEVGATASGGSRDLDLAAQVSALHQDLRQLGRVLDKRLLASSAKLDSVAYQVQSLDKRIGDRSPCLTQIRAGMGRPAQGGPLGASCQPASCLASQSQWSASQHHPVLLAGGPGDGSPSKVASAWGQGAAAGAKEEIRELPAPDDELACHVESAPPQVETEASLAGCGQTASCVAASCSAPVCGQTSPKAHRRSRTRTTFERSRTKDTVASLCAGVGSQKGAGARELVNPLAKSKTMAFGMLSMCEEGRKKRIWKRRKDSGLHCLSGLLIFLNVVFMTFSVQISMEALLQGRDPPSQLWWGSLAFALAFSGELAVRAAVEGREFLRGRSRGWNVFDTFILLLQWVDLACGVLSVTTLRSLRTLRVAPAARLIRWLRNAQELRLMMAAIRCSIISMMWALLLLASVVLIYALALQQTVQAQLERERGSALTEDLAAYYGSLQRTMLTVFMALSGGQDWSDLVRPLEEMSQIYLVVFSLFVAVVLFGLLNVLAAIFVEQSCRVRQNNATSNVRDLLESMSSDCGEGDRLAACDLEEMLHDKGFIGQLKSVSLTAQEVRGLFQLLDPCRTGCVNVQDFISAFMRLTGNARAVDIATMFYENKRILSQVAALAQQIEASLFAAEQQVDPGDLGRQKALFATPPKRTSKAER